MMRKIPLLLIILFATAAQADAVITQGLVVLENYDPNTRTWSSLTFDTTTVAQPDKPIYVGLYAPEAHIFSNWFGLEMISGVTFGTAFTLPAAGAKEVIYSEEYEGYEGMYWWWIGLVHPVGWPPPLVGVHAVWPITITDDIGTAAVSLRDSSDAELDTLQIQAPGPWPYYTLTVAVEPNDVGIDTLSPSVGQHQRYHLVDLHAPPYLECPDIYYFDHWEGDVASTSAANTTIFMDADKAVTAYYSLGPKECGDQCHLILKGDLNEDCYINFTDFALYCEQWLSCTHPDCD